GIVRAAAAHALAVDDHDPALAPVAAAAGRSRGSIGRAHRHRHLPLECFGAGALKSGDQLIGAGAQTIVLDYAAEAGQRQSEHNSQHRDGDHQLQNGETAAAPAINTEFHDGLAPNKNLRLRLSASYRQEQEASDQRSWNPDRRQRFSVEKAGPWGARHTSRRARCGVFSRGGGYGWAVPALRWGWPGKSLFATEVAPTRGGFGQGLARGPGFDLGLLEKAAFVGAALVAKGPGSA